MRKVKQAVILIVGGLVGMLGVIAQFLDREYLMSLMLLCATIAAFSLAGWLIWKAKQE
jgi:hypothetical protein